MPKPGTPARPEVSPNGPGTLRIAWSVPEDADPEITATTVKVRIVGSQRFQNYDHSTGKLVNKGGGTVPAETSEILLWGCEEGIAYEAIIAVMNGDGWSDMSAPSLPGCIGELKSRAKPQRPGPPKLDAVASGRLRVTWTLPEACPPIEASQVQITEVSTGLTLLVDATNGKLISTGRTTFGASRTECNINGATDGVEYVAAVCCRNAEGFGEYSIPSDSVANPLADTSGMQLVLHQGPSTEIPIMEPLGQGQMKVRWLLPDGAKSTMVKLRRVGDNNWYLCGGAAVTAPESEVTASGLEDGIEYESMIAFLISGRWCMESGISKPTCIGHKKLPSIPDAPKEPRILVDQAQGGVKVKWTVFSAVPQLTGCHIKVRPVGCRTWQYVHPINWKLTDKEVDPVPVTNLENPVLGLTPGVRYEAQVAFRNKLGAGPYSASSDPACIGRPTPKLMRCQNCFNDFDLQHAEYTKAPEAFWCPHCRFRRMDPFNAVIEPYGLLLCHILVRGTMSFSLDLPDIKQWRKDDQAVFMRMCKVDSDTCASIWPKKLTFEANGAEVFAIKEPEEGHIRRDVPMNISAGLKPGINTINITVEDDFLQSYVMSLVRTQAMTAQMIAATTPNLSEEDALARIMGLLEDTWAGSVDNEDEEEITCVISNKLKLRCPLSFERCTIPVRGEQCQHLQCFGLQAYLESNMKMRALNNRWTCPVCSCVLRPQDLRVDSYVEKVLSETPEHIDEVLIMQDGNYRCIEDFPMDQAYVEKEKAKEAAAREAEARTADDVEVTEMYTTIADGDDKGEKRKAAQQHTSVQKTLTKRQRARMQRSLEVAEGEENSD